MWYSMDDYPDSGWVFVYFEDGIEYGRAFYGKLDIGGMKVDVDDALYWCKAPEPTNKML